METAKVEGQMWDHRLNELLLVLAGISLVSWSIVGITALIRIGAQLRYRQKTPTPVRRNAEEAAE